MSKCYKTKTFYCGLLGVAGGIAMCIFGDPAGGVATISASLMAIFGRQLPPKY